MNTKQRTGKKQHLRLRKRVVVFLSFLVAVCTVSSLIMPAVTMSGDMSTLVCEEDHEHTSKCYAAIDLTEEEISYETLALEHADGAEITAEETISFDEEIAVSIRGIRLPAEFFLQNDQTVVYKLPETFLFAYERTGEILSIPEGEKEASALGTYRIGTDGELELSYRPEVIDANIAGEEIEGNLRFTAAINPGMRQEDNTVSVSLRTGETIVLNMDAAEEEIEEEIYYTANALNDEIMPMSDDDGEEEDEGHTHGVSDELIITDTSMRYRHNPWEAYQDFDPDTDTLNTTDQLEITIAYTIPGHVLNTGHKSVTYQLPDSLNITEAMSGNIFHGRSVVGTFTVSKSGEVVLTFNDDYVHKDEIGETITGHLVIDAYLNKDKINEDGEIIIDFSDEVKIKIDTDKSDDSDKTTGDITVNKYAEQLNVDEGTMVYKITVWSNSGTNSEVTLTDEMIGTTINGEIVVKNTSTQEVVSYQTGEKSDTGFTITLPQMDAGSGYTIEYPAKFDPASVPVEGTVVQNNVTATSTDSNEKTIGDRHELKTQIHPNVLKKSGQYDKETGKVTWVVTINESKKNLNGWTLDDVLNGEHVDNKVQLTNTTTGEVTEISLPYTFGETSDPYMITYTETAEAGFGSRDVVNIVKLTKDGEEIIRSSTVTTDKDIPNPLKKEAGEITVQEDGKTYEVSWKLTIDTSETAIPIGTELFDELENQYFTKAQILDIGNMLKEAFEEAELSEDSYTFEAQNDWWQWSTVSSNLSEERTYRGWRIRLKDAIPKGIQMELTYTATTVVDSTDAKTVKNTAQLNHNANMKVEVSTDVTPSTPTIKKTDGGKQEQTTKQLDSKSGMFDWDIEVTIPAGYKSGTLVMIEHLPEGVTLTKLTVDDASSTFEETDITEAKEYTIAGHTFKTSISGQDITVEIPESYATNGQKQILNFVVQVQANEGLEWEKKEDYFSKTFTNKAELKKNDGTEIGVGEHTQTILVPDENSDGKLVDKKMTGEIKHIDYNGRDEIQGNYIPYQIVINPNAADLIEGSNILILEDVLTFIEDPYYQPPNVDLVRDSVKVYVLDANGEKGRELTTDEFAYHYVASPKRYTWENRPNQPEDGTNYLYLDKGPSYRTLTIELPDEEALLIEYAYVVTGTIGYKIELDNKATLKGVSSDTDNSSANAAFNIAHVRADADAKGVELLKYDTENEAKFLPGAEFKLYEYRAYCYWSWSALQWIISGQWVEIPGTYITDENGRIVIPDIENDRAYRLVEVNAPDGYLLDETEYDFAIKTRDWSTTYSLLWGYEGDYQYIPYENRSFSAFERSAHILTEGQVIEIGNVPTYITVNKIWLDVDGNQKKHTSGSITVQLERKLQSSPDTEWAVYSDPVTITPDSGGNWTYTWNIPSEDKISSSGEYYVFRVKEVEIEGYDVSYSFNNEAGIRAGTITITNKEKKTYVLPETGGSGTSSYTAVGMILILISLILYGYRRVRRTGKEVSS